MRIHFIYFIVIICLASSCSSKQKEVFSPDGRIRLQFALNDSNRMTYQIEVDSIPFVASSCLGFEAENGINLHKEFRIVELISLARMKPGRNLGEKIKPFATITMKWLFTCLMQLLPN